MQERTRLTVTEPIPARPEVAVNGHFNPDRTPNSTAQIEQPQRPETPQPAPKAGRSRLQALLCERNLVLLSLVTGALSHGINVFKYPLYITDEGIYLEQAWSVLRQGHLSPYTYFYDHAPAGWLLIAGWIQILPGQFQTFGTSVNTGRVLMLLLHVASVFLLFKVTRRISGSRIAAFLATFLFNLSPLAVFYQREVLLDNIMVFWVLLSLYLATSNGRRVTTPMLSGLAFGIAVLTKENAIFFTPVVLYLLYGQVRHRFGCRFALGFWPFTAFATISLYFLFAVLKNELFPEGFNFNLNVPPAKHVSLLYTIWWQAHRSQGSILNTHSLVWQFSLGRWLPKDAFFLVGGSAMAGVNLLIGLGDRQRYRGYLVAALMAVSYGFYLARGSLMLDFYIVPLLPFLAMNIGMLFSWITRGLPQFAMGSALTVVLGVLLLHPSYGYLLKVNSDHKLVPQDQYMLPLTTMQAEQLKFVRSHIPADAKIVMDDDLWVEMHDVAPYYKWAHSHWKASGDPDVRDKLFAQDWQRIDYFVMSNKMRVTMEQNNDAGQYDWILQALDHAQRIWDLQRGDIELAVYQVQK